MKHELLLLGMFVPLFFTCLGDAYAGTNPRQQDPVHTVVESDTPKGDGDDDGITDSWTQRYFGHPMGRAEDHSGAMDDPDGDGFSNLQEFINGTDPRARIRCPISW